jgi:hypothetical protein
MPKCRSNQIAAPFAIRDKSAPPYLVGPEKQFKHLLWNVIGMILVVLDCRQNLPAHSKSLQSASMKPTSSDTAQTFFAPRFGKTARSAPYALSLDTGHRLEGF